MITPKTKIEVIKQLTALIKRIVTDSNTIEKFHSTVETQNNRTVTRIEIITQ